MRTFKSLRGKKVKLSDEVDERYRDCIVVEIDSDIGFTLALESNPKRNVFCAYGPKAYKAVYGLYMSAGERKQFKTCLNNLRKAIETNTGYEPYSGAARQDQADMAKACAFNQ